MLTEIEKKVVASIQGDIPVVARPYAALAQEVGISEDEFVGIVDDLHQRGIIRRFGATIRHQMSGFSANAMVAWKVDEQQVDAVGKIFAAFPGVSHCYRRNPVTTWPYNLYTMIHAGDEDACRQTAQNMSAATSVENYTLLFSRKELKKTSMVYFPSED